MMSTHGSPTRSVRAATETSILREPPKILVAFKPPATGLGGDQLFHAERYCHIGDASHWLQPTRALAECGLARGIEFHTDDMVHFKDAAVLVFGEVPMSRRQVRRVREDYPHLKLILQILETPVGRDWVFDPANHSDFDAVVSYNPALNDGRRYFSFRIPAGGIRSINVPPGAPWAKRKTACMVASFPHIRRMFIRRSGLGMIQKGWRFTPRTWWNYVSEGGALYGERLRIAAQCEETLGDQFDIFGPGWPVADRSGKPRRGFVSAHGPYEGSKLELFQHYRFTVAYENCLNDCGYISEKLFDGLLAGCVPIYLGNLSIDTYVPDGVFIDARRFPSRGQLVEYIASMSEGRWHQMREAGRAFLRSATTDDLFGSGQYIDALIGAVRRVTSTKSDAMPGKR